MWDWHDGVQDLQMVWKCLVRSRRVFEFQMERGMDDCVAVEFGGVLD